MSNLYDAMIMRLSFLRMCRNQISIDRVAQDEKGNAVTAQMMVKAERKINEAIRAVAAVTDHIKKEDK